MTEESPSYARRKEFVRLATHHPRPMREHPCSVRESLETHSLEDVLQLQDDVVEAVQS